MNKILTLIAVAVLGANAYATVDGHDHVFLVVQNIQLDVNDENAFFVERAPILGCYGLPKGPQIELFTAEYRVPSNIGCGGPAFQDNINALTCATITTYEESKDFDTFERVTLDISKCEGKNSPQFVETVKNAANMNFSTKKTKLQLTIIK